MSTSWAYVDSDEEFADEGEKAFRGKTATIVLIDCTPEMFQAWKADSEEVPFRAAIKVSHVFNYISTALLLVLTTVLPLELISYLILF